MQVASARISEFVFIFLTSSAELYEEERKIEMANENFFTRREMFAKNMMGLRTDKTRWNHTMGQPIFWSQTEHGAASQMDQHYFGKYR